MSLFNDPRTVLVNTVSTVLAGPNLKREKLIIGAPQTNRITLSFRGPAVLDQGITLYPGGPTLTLTNDDVGEALQDSISAISAVASQSVHVVDIFHG